MRSLAFAILAALIVGTNASAPAAALPPVTLYESATLTSHNSLGGTIISDVYLAHQFIGVRFEITQAVVAQEIGGNFIRGRDFGNSQIYGALFRLIGPGYFPQSVHPINTPDLLAAALITAPPSINDDVAVPIGPVTLSPGYYAMLFGTNQFGATGEGQASPNNTRLGNQSYIYYSMNEYDPGGWAWHSYTNGNERYFLRGVVVPEPTSAWGIYAIGASLFALRRQHHAAIAAAGKNA